MRAACIKHMIELAQGVESGFGPFVRESIEVGVVVPSILEANLRKAGYVIDSTPGDKHGAWVTIKQSDAVVARAFSHDRRDAIIQAVYAGLREGR